MITRLLDGAHNRKLRSVDMAARGLVNNKSTEKTPYPYFCNYYLPESSKELEFKDWLIFNGLYFFEISSSRTRYLFTNSSQLFNTMEV